MISGDMKEQIADRIANAAKATEDKGASPDHELSLEDALELAGDIQAVHEKAKRMGAPFIGAFCAYASSATAFTSVMFTHPDGRVLDSDFVAAYRVLHGGGGMSSELAKALLGVNDEQYLYTEDDRFVVLDEPRTEDADEENEDDD